MLISKKGFFIAGAGGVVGSVVPGLAGTDGAPTIPKRGDGTYDYATLNAMMVTVKGSPMGKAETKVILGAESDVSYETLVQTMDTVRETGADHKILFPDVTLAAM